MLFACCGKLLTFPPIFKKVQTILSSQTIKSGIGVDLTCQPLLANTCSGQQACSEGIEETSDSWSSLQLEIPFHRRGCSVSWEDVLTRDFQAEVWGLSGECRGDAHWGCGAGGGTRGALWTPFLYQIPCSSFGVKAQELNWLEGRSFWMSEKV